MSFMCPPSPPPAHSVNSAFFQSPFSVSNCTNTPSSASASPPKSPRGGDPQSPRGDPHYYQRMMMTNQQQQQQQQQDENHQQPSHNSNYSHSHSHSHHWKPAMATRLVGSGCSHSDWTPLSSRPTHCNNNNTTTTNQHHHLNPVPTEDRLDRLLAEMDSTSTSSTLLPPKLITPSNHLMTTAATPQTLGECWERSCLETRFQPLHASVTPTTLRRCLKTGPTLCDDSSSSSSSLETDITPCMCPSSLCPTTPVHPAPVLSHPTTPSVRFDNKGVEHFLTWSKESYDRSGPEPITKLNIRDILELKLIKEELGISHSTPAAAAT